MLYHFFTTNVVQKVFGLGGILTAIFGLWQMDLITSGPVWSPSWTSPAGGYYNQSFEFGRIVVFGHVLAFTTSVGGAYDLCQALIVIGLVVAVLAFWLWDK